MAILQRETAHRLFAEEFNASRAVLEASGEKEPSFLVSPTGAKVNRLHVVGVCTDVETVGESGDVVRARISDPTGLFTVYAGQYQPEAANVLSGLAGNLPAFVAVTGKARTYEPEPGSLFVSVRPETVTVVEERVRDQWILDTVRRTVERLKAVDSVRGQEAPEAAALTATGMRSTVAEGAVLAHQHYALTDTARYWQTVRTALQGILPGGSVPVHAAPEPRAEGGQAPATEVPAAAERAAQDAEEEALDEGVMAVVQRLEGDEGARWDDILGEAKSLQEGLSAEGVEESLNRLMDKGLVYEPTLGVLKST